MSALQEFLASQPTREHFTDRQKAETTNIPHIELEQVENLFRLLSTEKGGLGDNKGGLLQFIDSEKLKDLRSYLSNAKGFTLRYDGECLDNSKGFGGWWFGAIYDALDERGYSIGRFSINEKALRQLGDLYHKEDPSFPGSDNLYEIVSGLRSIQNALVFEGLKPETDFVIKLDKGHAQSLNTAPQLSVS